MSAPGFLYAIAAPGISPVRRFYRIALAANLLALGIGVMAAAATEFAQIHLAQLVALATIAALSLASAVELAGAAQAGSNSLAAAAIIVVILVGILTLAAAGIELDAAVSLHRDIATIHGAAQ